MRRRQLALDLLVRDDAAARGIDEEDAARVQPFLEHDVLGRDVEHADLGCHDDEVVLGDVIARGPEAVAVEHGADHVPSEKAIDAGPSHGSISDEWYS